MQFDLEAETFSQREKTLIQRLGEYRLIDRDIEEQRKIISGELSRVPLGISAMAPKEDDPAIMAYLRTQPVSERLTIIVNAVKQHVNVGGDKYANRLRIAKRLERVTSTDEADDQALQDAYMMLTERQEEEYLELTPAERYAVMREEEVAKAAKELDTLIRRKRAIQHALEDMERYEPEGYKILWHKYVMHEHWERVREIAGRDGTALTIDEYRWSRKKALQQFDKWAYGMG
jgi:DNA primase large subunit